MKSKLYLGGVPKFTISKSNLSRTVMNIPCDMLHSTVENAKYGLLLTQELKVIMKCDNLLQFRVLFIHLFVLRDTFFTLRSPIGDF